MGVGKVIGTADGGGSIYHARSGAANYWMNIFIFSRFYSYENNITLTKQKNPQNPNILT